MNCNFHIIFTYIQIIFILNLIMFRMRSKMKFCMIIVVITVSSLLGKQHFSLYNIELDINSFYIEFNNAATRMSNTARLNNFYLSESQN
jgi:hypothetical protein